MCSNADVVPDTRDVFIEATHETPCHAWCGCDVDVGDGGSLSVQVLTAELQGTNCSTSLILETDDVNYNGTSICSNESHTGIGTNYGPFTDWVRIVFQRKNCSDDSSFRVRIFSK